MAFHNERTEEVGKDGYRVRVPKTATVGQLLEQVRQRVGEPAGTGPLRLLEVRDCRICQARDASPCSLKILLISYHDFVSMQATADVAVLVAFLRSAYYIVFSVDRRAHLQLVCRSWLVIIQRASALLHCTPRRCSAQTSRCWI